MTTTRKNLRSPSYTYAHGSFTDLAPSRATSRLSRPPTRFSGTSLSLPSYRVKPLIWRVQPLLSHATLDEKGAQGHSNGINATIPCPRSSNYTPSSILKPPRHPRELIVAKGLVMISSLPTSKLSLSTTHGTSLVRRIAGSIRISTSEPC